MTKMADLRTPEDQGPRLEPARQLDALILSGIQDTMLPTDKVDTMLKGVRNAQKFPH